MTTGKIKLQEIRERCEQATPGPWYRDGSRKGTQNQIVSPAEDNARATVMTDNGSAVAAVHITAWKQERRDARPDAEFIAHARTDIPALLDWIGRAQWFIEHGAKLGQEDYDELRAAVLAELDDAG